MLVAAYTAAQAGDMGVVHELARVFERPFDEHPDVEAKYYRRTPTQMQSKAGVSYFS